MPQSEEQARGPLENHHYLSRELSWLEFNYRVLQEAMDQDLPLMERLRFLISFSQNLDEYFMVRVARIKQKIALGHTSPTDDGQSPLAQLQAVQQRLQPMITQQQVVFRDRLKPTMASHGIHLLAYTALTARQKALLGEYVEEHVLPILTPLLAPLALDTPPPTAYGSTLSLGLAIQVRAGPTEHPQCRWIKLPRVLPRFIPLPQLDGPPAGVELGQTNKPLRWTGVPLEEIITHHLAHLVPEVNIDSCCIFRLTRSARLPIDDDAGNLMQAVETGLRQRRLQGSSVRLELQRPIDAAMEQQLITDLGLTGDDIYRVDVHGLLGLGDLKPLLAHSQAEPRPRPWLAGLPTSLMPTAPYPQCLLQPPGAPADSDLFAHMRRQDHLLHHPYHSFTATVQRLLEAAAVDPLVVAIKITLYRTSGDAPIVKALIAAARAGKQVVVVVEIQARLDEESNIHWARRLEQVGVHVVYGIVGFKTHTQVALILRQEETQIRSYCHIGTGNYNTQKTRQPTDLGLLSSRGELGADLIRFFNFLTGFSTAPRYSQLIVAPTQLRPALVELIQREAVHCQQGKPSRVIVKVNSLTDPELIEALYMASQAGVPIDLIVRGMCCLRPGVPGLSETIRVVSIIGQFIEHSRILYFENDGDPTVLMGSADWQVRNLDDRIEAMVTIIDPGLQQQLRGILQLLLRDNRHSWQMQSDGSYQRLQPLEPQAEVCAQSLLMEQAQDFTTDDGR